MWVALESPDLGAIKAFKESLVFKACPEKGATQVHLGLMGHLDCPDQEGKLEKRERKACQELEKMVILDPLDLKDLPVYQYKEDPGQLVQEGPLDQQGHQAFRVGKEFPECPVNATTARLLNILPDFTLLARTRNHNSDFSE